MPYDSQGNFTRVMNWQDDAANAVPIVASRHDDEDDNFAQGFNEVLCRDGRAAMTGALKMGNFKITGLGNATTDNDAVNKSQLDSAQTTLNSAITNLGNSVVKLTSDQTIAGTKTFNESPIVPTPATSDNSTKAASTAFVKNNFSLLTGLPKWNSAISTTASTYTVPSRGWLFVEMAGSSEDSTVGYAYINNKEVGYILSRYGRSVGDSSIFIPVNTGDVLTFSGNINTGLQKIFYPAN